MGFAPRTLTEKDCASKMPQCMAKLVGKVSFPSHLRGVRPFAEMKELATAENFPPSLMG